MKNVYNHRLRLVEPARQRGIKRTARLFATTAPTVRKWLRRDQQHGPSGLVELSSAAHHQPRKTPTLEQQLLELRRTLPTFGARRLTGEFDLPSSHRALERIWRSHNLMIKRRGKYPRKQDLAHIKAQWALFQQVSADTKDLDGIPHYWPQAQQLGLPAVQYTAREVRSRLLFWAFAERRTAAASAVLAAHIQQRLDRCGVSLRDLVWQTGNGSEFIGGHDKHGKPTEFPAALPDSQHVRIPPAAHTYQSDVETVQPERCQSYGADAPQAETNLPCRWFADACKVFKEEPLGQHSNRSNADYGLVRRTVGSKAEAARHWFENTIRWCGHYCNRTHSDNAYREEAIME